MQGYSLLGYANAVRQRTGKTLLVEGPTDSMLINRVRHEVLQGTQGISSGAIDGAAMLQDSSDPSVHGKGNKAKVLALLDLVANDNRVQTAIAGKLGTLIDREWDGLTAGRELLDPWIPPVQNPPHFQTVGHSMENYFFTSEAFKRWLLQSYPEYVDHGFLSAIENRFVSMIAIASVWSIEIRDMHAIGKAAGLIKREFLSWNNGAYELDASIGPLLAQRQIIVLPNFIAEINLRSKSYLATFGTQSPGIWLCHGHLGEEMLWSCIANLAEEMQVNQHALQAIERGNPANRFRCLVDFLAREKLNDAAPLREAVEWLCC